MVEAISKVRSVGGSLMVRIPKDLAKLESIQDGQLVKIKVKKLRKSFFGALKVIKIEDEHIRASDFD
mgnify:CR=1 FL=1